MPSLSEVAVRFSAAVETIVQRVREDRRRVSKDVGRLLAVIEERLFLPGFDVNELKRLTSPTTATLRRFRHELGRLPAAYVQHRRLEAAHYALSVLGATVEEAGLLVGYANRAAFSRAFRRWSSQAPSEVSGEASSAAATPAAEPQAPAPPPIARYRRAAAGEMDPDAAAALVRRLRRRFPNAGREHGHGRRPSGRCEVARVELAQPEEPHDRLLAEALWAAARDLPREEVRDLLCNVVRFRSPALFQALGKHSGNGTGSGADRVAAAELGMQVLEESGRELGGETLCDLKALGWAWVGRARQEAGDVAGAERAFEFCDEEWATPRERRDPLVEAEIGVLKAPLRLQQRRFDEACRLVDRAIELFREDGASHLLARALVDRARMARHRDDTETDLVLLEEARELVEEERDPVLVCRTFLRLAQARVRTGRSKSAEAALDRARAASQAVDDPLLTARLDRTEGLVHRELGRVAEAEASLLRALGAFGDLGDLPRAVLTSLDLAELHHLRGQAARVRELVAAAVPMVERLKMHRRSLEALRLLKSALDAEELTLTLLRRVRDCVEAIHRDTRA